MMSNPNPFSGNQGNNTVNGSLQGRVIVIGQGNTVEIKEQDQAEVLLLLHQVLERVSTLKEAGVTSGIASPAPSSARLISGENILQTSSPSAASTASSHGGDWLPPSVSPDDIRNISQEFSPLDQLLKQVDQRVGGQVRSAEAIQIGQDRLQVVDLLIQQGNLALWRFRHAYSRLFAGQVIAFILARVDWPTPPELQLLSAQAGSNLEVQRGIALMEMMQQQRPELAMSEATQLSQGRWRQVLDEWVAHRQLHEEAAQYARTQIEAMGEPYRPEEVQATQQEAGLRFSEVLKRDPHNTTALVNLALLLVESATFSYVESGVANRARLQRARDLFRQARDLLTLRTDNESRVALGKCLLYLATSMSPDAVLESVQWAAIQTQIFRSVFTQKVQSTIRWDVYQRTLATNDPTFYQPETVQQALRVFSTTSETLLIEQCNRVLQRMEQTRSNLPRTTQQMQGLAPVVGTWRYQGKNMLSFISGMLIFDAGGIFRWQAEQQNLMNVPQRITVIGQYEVVDMTTIRMRGQCWTLQLWSNGIPMLTPFLNQALISVNTGVNLFLITQQEGYQIQCQRM